MTGGNFALDPISLNKFSICGTATSVPTTSIIIIPTNCKILGINIFFIFLVNSVDSSKYLTACSNEFDSEPDNSPTFIIFVYMYGNTFE